jgi:hypothetical protein
VLVINKDRLYVKMDPDLDRLSGSKQPEKNRINNADISIVMNKRITINVPVVFMAPMGPNGTRFARAISGPKKVSIFRAHPFQCLS